jgi:replicative DNA helicase
VVIKLDELDNVFDANAERQVLSNCINKNGVLHCTSEGLLPKHFYLQINAIIYKCITHLYVNNLNIDVISILSLIEKGKKIDILNEYGGEDYLNALEIAPTTQNIEIFINNIKSFYIKREAYKICSNTMNDILNKDINPIETLNIKTMELSLENGKGNKTYKMGDKLRDRLKNTDVNKVEGLSTGFDKLDQITGGASKDDLIIVCAESKTGKSVVLMNWAKHIAIDSGLPILWIDTEQSEEEQEFRLLSIVSRIPEIELKRGLWQQNTMYGTLEDKKERLEKALKLIESRKFFYEYMPDFTTEKIIAKTREYYLKEGIVCMFFDYIQLTDTLLASYKGMRDDIILTTFANGLKKLGGDLKIPIFTASQENRTGYGGTEKDAKNIGGSIGILQKATQLLFLVNMTDEEIAMNQYANQNLLVKYLRHGESGQKLKIFYNRPLITMMEV